MWVEGTFEWKTFEQWEIKFEAGSKALVTI